MIDLELIKESSPTAYRLVLECMEETGKGPDEALEECLEMMTTIRNHITQENN